MITRQPPPATRAPRTSVSNETIHPLQAMVNGMNAHWQSERAQTGMTLGRFIAALESLDQSATVEGLGELISYRGHYCDLAFEPDPTPRTVAGLLAKCRAAMGAVFEGYKGGEFVMGATTPVWVSEYGRSSGLRLMGLTPTAPHTPITEHYDDNQTTPARADAPREAVRPAVRVVVHAHDARETLAIDGTAADIRERVRAALARTDLVPIHHVEGITDIVTRALGVQP